jgi:hypothetical protein
MTGMMCRTNALIKLCNDTTLRARKSKYSCNFSENSVTNLSEICLYLWKVGNWKKIALSEMANSRKVASSKIW